MVVILVVLTERDFRFSLFISHLLAKAIPVRGAKLKSMEFHQTPLPIAKTLIFLTLPSYSFHQTQSSSTQINSFMGATFGALPVQ
ncbi:hypothetical protein B4916_18610 [Yersinia intermedia]|nr:hypothetical protein B4916_18610 [Yersinia intermedia]